MRHKLKLAIYQFSIRKTAAKSAIKNSEALKKISGEKVKNQVFQKFLEKYIESYNGEFVGNADLTKKLKTKDVTFASEKNFIYGMMTGGLTNIEFDIYDEKKPDKPSGKLRRDQISALSYYFFLWIPYNSDHGVIMIQYYNSSSLTSSIVEHLKTFFRNNGHTLNTYPFVPKKLKDTFINKSSIKKIAIINRKVSKEVRDTFNPLISTDEDFELVLEIRRLKKDPSKLQKTINKFGSSVKNLLKSDLKELGFDSLDGSSIQLYYEGENGKRAHAKLNTNMEIMPSIDLSDDLKEKDKDSPELSKIHDHCVKLLAGVRRELI